MEIPKITTYDRLERHVRSWAEGHVPFLAIIGRGGLGKTHSYESLDIPYHTFRGRTTAFTIFETVKSAPDRPIVFDDIQALLKDASCRDLLKQLCDTKPERVIRWSTNALNAADQSFTCTSKVLVVLNCLPKKDADVEAILDRFDVKEFDPTKSEILDVMRKVAIDPDDVDLFAELPIMPSLRTLKTYEGWKDSPYLNAVEELLSQCGVPDEIKLMMDVLKSTPRGKHIAEYQKLSGKSHAAAKKEWGRKHKIAEQLVDAQKTVKLKVTRKSA